MEVPSAKLHLKGPSHAPVKQWEAGLSCDWSAVAGPIETVRALPSFILAIPVWKCHRLGLTIKYCPIVDPSSPNYNLAHCLLLMPPNLIGKKARAGMRDEFLQAAEYCYLREVDCRSRARTVVRSLRRRLRRVRLKQPT